MSTVHVTTKINAPVEKVWEVVMDPSRLGDWVTIHRWVKDVSSDPLREGSTMTQCLHLRGVSFNVNWKVVDMNAPRHAEWEGLGPARSRAIIRYELQPAGDSATTFEYINEFHPPGGRLGSAASRVIVGGVSEREAERSLERLKAVVERSNG
jgi:uncharacterized protein YndB with AHSA1/START domain